MLFPRRLTTLTLTLFVKANGSDLSRFRIDSSRYDNVIVISDCHGDYRNAVKSLYLGYRAAVNEPMPYSDFVGLLDAGVASNVLPSAPLLAPPLADRTVVVQLGDLADRGHETRLLFTLFERLPAIIGWRTETVIGNHELMGHQGLMGDVSRNDIRSFGGLAARRHAFSVNGELWKGITTRSGIVIRFGGSVASTADSADTLFVHAGVDVSWFSLLAALDYDVMKSGSSEEVDMDKLNSVVAMLGTEAGSKRFSNTLAEDSSPVWTRHFAFTDEAELCGTLLPGILRAFNVARVVVGHQPQKNKRIGHRCGGQIVFSDVKISRSMPDGGQPAALILKVDAATGLLSSINGHYWTSRRSAPLIAPLRRVRQKVKEVKEEPLGSSLKRTAGVQPIRTQEQEDDIWGFGEDSDQSDDGAEVHDEEVVGADDDALFIPGSEGRKRVKLDSPDSVSDPSLHRVQDFRESAVVDRSSSWLDALDGTSTDDADESWERPIRPGHDADVGVKRPLWTPSLKINIDDGVLDLPGLTNRHTAVDFEGFSEPSVPSWASDDFDGNFDAILDQLPK